MAEKAILSLGGNVGDVAATFARAVRHLEANGAARVTAMSSLWRTPPWGMTDQPDFLNMAVAIETNLPPQELLQLCLQIEKANGRTRDTRWGPRTLDIDIVLFGDVNLQTQQLTLPHPRAHERAFVLAPIVEIAPAAIVTSKTVSQWLLQVRANNAGGASDVQIEDTATAAFRDALQR